MISWNCPPLRRRRSSAAGFSLIEVAISLLLIGGLMVASLSAIGAAARSDMAAADRLRGTLLAQDLMAEILQKPYADPINPLAALGRDLGEVLSLGRESLNDVDDYLDLVESPPRLADDTPIPDAAAFERRVSVAWVHLANPSTTSLTDTGVKRIIVEVRRGGRTVARLTALRTAAAAPPPYDP